MHAAIYPVRTLKPLSLPERGKILQKNAEVQLSHLPRHIADRELKVISQALDLSQENLVFRHVTLAYGPGNIALIKIRSEAVTEVFSAFGRPGLPAEIVAQQLVGEVQEYLESNVPVGKHLADQLLIPVTLAGKGAFMTQQPSSHTATNMAVIHQFMGVRFEVAEIRPRAWSISLDRHNATS